MEIFFCASCSLEMALRSLSSGVPAGTTIFSIWLKARALLRRDEARMTLRAAFLADLLLVSDGTRPNPSSERVCTQAESFLNAGLQIPWANTSFEGAASCSA